jgi:hypothetical protein
MEQSPKFIPGSEEGFNLDFSTLENVDVLENFDFDAFLNGGTEDGFEFGNSMDLDIDDMSNYDSATPEQPSAQKISKTRPPNVPEFIVMDIFTKHASICSVCSDPIRAWETNGQLCARGSAYARDLVQYIFSMDRRPFSVIDRKKDGENNEIEVPDGYEIIDKLIEALHMGLDVHRRNPTTTHNGQKEARRAEIEAKREWLSEIHEQSLNQTPGRPPKAGHSSDSEIISLLTPTISGSSQAAARRDNFFDERSDVPDVSRHNNAMRRPRGPGGRFSSPEEVAAVEAPSKKSKMASESDHVVSRKKQDNIEDSSLQQRHQEKLSFPHRAITSGSDSAFFDPQNSASVPGDNENTEGEMSLPFVGYSYKRFRPDAHEDMEARPADEAFNAHRAAALVGLYERNKAKEEEHLRSQSAGSVLETTLGLTEYEIRALRQQQQAYTNPTYNPSLIQYGDGSIYRNNSGSDDGGRPAAEETGNGLTPACFDDNRRRYSGAILQRAVPPRESEDMDLDKDANEVERSIQEEQEAVKSEKGAGDEKLKMIIDGFKSVQDSQRASQRDLLASNAIWYVDGCETRLCMY